MQRLLINPTHNYSFNLLNQSLKDFLNFPLINLQDDVKRTVSEKTLLIDDGSLICFIWTSYGQKKNRISVL